jgi:hypothetical protein
VQNASATPFIHASSLQDEFLSKVPIPDSQIYALNDALGAKAAAADYEKVLK